jgi:hypothetical protein
MPLSRSAREGLFSFGSSVKAVDSSFEAVILKDVDISTNAGDLRLMRGLYVVTVKFDVRGAMDGAKLLRINPQGEWSYRLTQLQYAALDASGLFEKHYRRRFFLRARPAAVGKLRRPSRRIAPPALRRRLVPSAGCAEDSRLALHNAPAGTSGRQEAFQKPASG